MASVKLADNAYGTLGGALASTASSITFTSGHGARFPAVAAGECLYVCLLNSNNVLEEIQITTHTASADTADVVRAVGATTAKAWNAGDRIEARLSSTAILNKHADPLAVTGTGSSTIAGPLAVAKSLDLSGAAAGQIAFPASQNASSNANTLDDYEEGSWTPGVTFASGTGGITYAVQVATYQKVGNRAHVQAMVQLSSNGTSTGDATLTGLPFTANNTTNKRSAFAISANNLSGISGDVTCQLLPNTTALVLGYLGTGSGVNLNDTTVSDSAMLVIGGTYEV